MWQPPNVTIIIQVVPRYNIISGTCEKLCYNETYVISDIHKYRNFFAKRLISPLSPRNGCVGVNSLGITEFLCYKRFNEHYHLNSQLSLTTLLWAVKSCVQCVDAHTYTMYMYVYVYIVHVRVCVCARMYVTVHSMRAT